MLDRTSLTTRLVDIVRAATPGLDPASVEMRHANLRDAGLTSIAAVRLMLEIEAAFDVAIPDGELTPENFASIASIETMLTRLKGLVAA